MVWRGVIAAALLLIGVLASPQAMSRGQQVDLTPMWMTIPIIDVNAPIEVVGMDSEGLTMALPSGGGTVAWFDLSVKPGEVGNAILAGHVDFGPSTAVFWNLNKLKPGDFVNVFAKDGSQWVYQVDAATWYNNAEAPVDKVFGWTDEPVVTLITCGGVFDPVKRDYDRRLVITAKAAWDWRSQFQSNPTPQPAAEPTATPTN